ncbi:hypothetical protein AZE42_13620 [Rhizopogon vesiculosus]|uniref:Uncharacterized protein n=1 Tax=Rhizopogon vesiculosus TaxID=180088 RepID=A0A1J8Q295_9AGAM|nr:hypothetical protein AZE42_13620 [Rhizopogon vesiculosus]
MVVLYEGVDGFVEAAYAMADECDLYLHNSVLYNMPYKVDLPPPYYCVSRGHYIGVFVSCIWKDIESDI